MFLAEVIGTVVAPVQIPRNLEQTAVVLQAPRGRQVAQP